MFAPSAELVEKYVTGLITDPDPGHRRHKKLIKRYAIAQLTRTGKRDETARASLVCRGPDAVLKVRTTVGHIVNERNERRDDSRYLGITFSIPWERHLLRAGGFGAPDPESAECDLKIVGEYSDSDGAWSITRSPFRLGAKVEKTSS